VQEGRVGLRSRHQRAFERGGKARQRARAILAQAISLAISES
jgi:hypothetical protein